MPESKKPADKQKSEGTRPAKEPMPPKKGETPPHHEPARQPGGDRKPSETGRKN